MAMEQDTRPRRVLKGGGRVSERELSRFYGRGVLVSMTCLRRKEFCFRLISLGGERTGDRRAEVQEDLAFEALPISLN